MVVNYYLMPELNLIWLGEKRRSWAYDMNIQLKQVFTTSTVSLITTR
jgi:hypothetical protein